MDVHRPRLALEGQVHGFLEHVGRVVDVGEEIRLLGRRREHRLRVGRAVQAGCVVDRSTPLPLERDVARDRQDRIGVGHRDREPGEQVEGSGTNRREAHPEAVREHRVPARHERRRLLVPGHDRPDLVGVLERQHQAGDVLTVASERGLDSRALEPFDDSFVDLHLLCLSRAAQRGDRDDHRLLGRLTLRLTRRLTCRESATAPRPSKVRRRPPLRR